MTGISKQIFFHLHNQSTETEYLDTNTLAIEIFSKGNVNIVRQFHHSDLPITSAFMGKFSNDKEISSTYSRELTEKNWRQVQEQFPQGDILLTLECSDLKRIKVAG